MFFYKEYIKKICEGKNIQTTFFIPFHTSYKTFFFFFFNQLVMLQEFSCLCLVTFIHYFYNAVNIN